MWRQVYCSSELGHHGCSRAATATPTARLGGERDVSNGARLSLNARAACTTIRFADVPNASDVSALTRFERCTNDAMRSMDRVVTRPARVDNVTGRSRQAAGGYPKTGYQVFATSRVLVLSTKVNLWTTHPFLTARCTVLASCDVGHRRLPLPCKLG
jgi:hypothetical protein